MMAIPTCRLKSHFRDSQQRLSKLSMLVGGSRCGARIGASRCIIWWEKLIELEGAGAQFGATKRRMEKVCATLIANK